jgi:hypothetical protein
MSSSKLDCSDIYSIYTSGVQNTRVQFNTRVQLDACMITRVQLWMCYNLTRVPYDTCQTVNFSGKKKQKKKCPVTFLKQKNSKKNTPYLINHTNQWKYGVHNLYTWHFLWKLYAICKFYALNL